MFSFAEVGRLGRYRPTVYKIDRQRSKSRESDRQTVRRLWWMVFGFETGRKVRGRGRTRIGFAIEQRFQFGVKE